jgi:hypothetical protein
MRNEWRRAATALIEITIACDERELRALVSRASNAREF